MRRNIARQRNSGRVRDLGPVAPQKLHDRIEVVYEDPDLIVIEKAAGVISYPVDPREKNSAIQLVRQYWRVTGKENEHLYLLHRLDQQTSGLLVFAKTTMARHSLSMQFEQHTIIREYLAVTSGIPSRKQGVFRTFLGRDSRGKRSVESRGKQAVTHIEVVAENASLNRALVRCRLDTGRTHQIRIHLAHLHTPVLGDSVYGKHPADRLALHAAVLGFIHPRTKAPVVLRSSLPQSVKSLFHAAEKS